MTETIYDVAIVGAGAAGMTAAIYALRAKKSVLIFEEKVPGGQIINTFKIDNYPALPGVSGPDFSKSLKSQVESFGGIFEYSEVKKIEKTDSLFSIKTTDGDIFLSKTVILANGSKERTLGLENEEDYLGRGLSYCATCDGNFFKDKTVAVYGGGNSAVYSALYLASLAKKVYIIIRRDHFRVESHLVSKLKSKDNIEIIKNSLITGLNGKNSLDSVELSKNPSKPSSSGSSDKNASETQILPLNGLFVQIGRIPDNSRFKNLVSLDKDGFILSSETCKTSTEGVFCAGDTRQKSLHQLVTATSDGAISATAAIDFLSEIS